MPGPPPSSPCSLWLLPCPTWRLAVGVRELVSAPGIEYPGLTLALSWSRPLGWRSGNGLMAMVVLSAFLLQVPVLWCKEQASAVQAGE